MSEESQNNPDHATKEEAVEVGVVVGVPSSLQCSFLDCYCYPFRRPSCQISKIFLQEHPPPSGFLYLPLPTEFVVGRAESSYDEKRSA